MVNELHSIEAKSQQELGTTQISPFVARALSLGFAAILVLPGVVQIVSQIRSGRPFAEFLVLNGIPNRSTLRGFDRAVDGASVLRQIVQPRLQLALSSYFGFGNEKVVIGHGGWLYYGPGVDYIVGKPFLETDYLKLRTKKMVDKEGEADPAPDPRPALLDLAEDCAKRGIRLVLVPVPDKAMLQSSALARPTVKGFELPDNESFVSLAAILEHQGVEVFRSVRDRFDLSGTRYLRQDTHWTPAFMEEYARQLAQDVRVGGVAANVGANRFRLQSKWRSSGGDLVQMLNLPPTQMLYANEAVEVHEVIDASTGLPVEPEATARVLLLGDSFTNVYSVASLGWGEHAGLAEHLAYQLNERIDVIALNGAGATGVRSELRRAAMQGRLVNKRVLIYEFAVRDLAVENWGRVHLPAPGANPGSVVSVAATGTPKGVAQDSPSQPVAQIRAKARERGAAVGVRAAGPLDDTLEVTAVVTGVSKVPEPGMAPYKDCLTVVKFTTITVKRGELKEQVIVVAFWGMRDNIWTEAARLKSGDVIEMKLIPFQRADRIVRSTQRADDILDNDSPFFWATEFRKAKS